MADEEQGILKSLLKQNVSTITPCPPSTSCPPSNSYQQPTYAPLPPPKPSRTPTDLEYEQTTKLLLQWLHKMEQNQKVIISVLNVVRKGVNRLNKTQYYLPIEVKEMVE